MASLSPFMIRTLKLRQYRSIKSCDLQLGPLSFLVGPNGSGKSNVVDSLKLVSQSLNENLDNALRQRGGVSEVRRRSHGHPTHFTIDIRAGQGDLAMAYSFTVGATQDKGYKVTSEECTIDRAEFGSESSHFSIKNGVLQSTSLTFMPRLYDDRLALVALSGQDPFRTLFEGLAGIEVFSPSPEAMRAPQTPDPGESLRRDASNIASVLGTLETQTPRVKHQIEEFLAQIVPGIQSVQRAAAGTWETLNFRQDVAGSKAAWNFPATSVSDGTLRALGVLTAMLSTAAGPGADSPIAIEEPETALHLAAAGILLDAIRTASTKRQILVTSHSPDLLDSDSIRPEELFAVRSIHGTTVVDRSDEGAQLALRENLFTAGDLLRSDQLQPQTETSKQQVLL